MNDILLKTVISFLLSLSMIFASKSYNDGVVKSAAEGEETTVTPVSGALYPLTTTATIAAAATTTVTTTAATAAKNRAPEKPSKPKTPNTRGNTPGNITNYGYAALQGDWIFYNSEYLGGQLWAMKTDETNKQKLCEDDALFINVVGDDIFYENRSDGKKLYTIKIDGSGRKKLCDDGATWINVTDRRIYYSNESDGGCVYSIKTDGTGRIKLNEVNSDHVCAAGNSIYYRNFNRDDMRMYYINLNSINAQPVKVNDDLVMDINAVGNRVYYANVSDNWRTYSVKADGTDRKKLSDVHLWGVNVNGDYIYGGISSVNGGPGIAVMKTDGSGYKKICGEVADLINIVGDKIYYMNGNTIGMIPYFMNFDGTGNHPVD